jgi:hypothetical protein
MCAEALDQSPGNKARQEHGDRMRPDHIGAGVHAVAAEQHLQRR